VTCQETGCTFKAPLKIFLMHSHGKKLYNNSSVDLESLRPARREMPRVLIVPTGAMGRQRGLMFHSQIEEVRGRGVVCDSDGGVGRQARRHWMGVGVPQPDIAFGRRGNSFCMASIEKSEI
jgi:hypothetical protein